jgi:hypothetical protein
MGALQGRSICALALAPRFPSHIEGSSDHLTKAVLCCALLGGIIYTVCYYKMKLKYSRGQYRGMGIWSIGAKQRWLSYTRPISLNRLDHLRHRYNLQAVLIGNISA